MTAIETRNEAGKLTTQAIGGESSRKKIEHLWNFQSKYTLPSKSYASRLVFNVDFTQDVSASREQ